MSSINEMSASDVSSLLTSNQAKLETVQAQQDKVNTPEKTATASKEEVARAAQKEQQALAQASTGQVKVLNTGLSASTKARLKDRVRDSINVNLVKYNDESLSPNERVRALSKIIEGVINKPKKEILDDILKFFREHRNDEALQETNALQGLMLLEKADHYRARVFYVVMMGLARGTANRSNISVEAIRTLFRSDDFPNWVAVQLARRSR
jgi:hypothetical protein